MGLKFVNCLHEKQEVFRKVRNYYDFKSFSYHFSNIGLFYMECFRWLPISLCTITTHDMQLRRAQ